METTANLAKQKELAAYLFLHENQEDENAYIDPQSLTVYMQRACNLMSVVYLVQEMELATEKEMEAVLYEIGKSVYGTEKSQLRNFFRDLYLLCFMRKEGPRLGMFVALAGLDNFKTTLKDRLANLYNF